MECFVMDHIDKAYGVMDHIEIECFVRDHIDKESFVSDHAVIDFFVKDHICSTRNVLYGIILTRNVL